ncbi:hypothetical protein E2C01_060811 [Portunus trituberculatus]|uniref:Uncharacterized protein n=1 Tax=Portunus trituberculatus TaxID=210409 RepID=A0A5B7HA25_PORTR|nr:hypothetical protein [Portunus trituberculatus]
MACDIRASQCRVMLAGPSGGVSHTAAHHASWPAYSIRDVWRLMSNTEPSTKCTSLETPRTPKHIWFHCTTAARMEVFQAIRATHR